MTECYICQQKKCVPENINIDEEKASVGLQDLLNHTASRIVFNQKDTFEDERLEGIFDFELVSKIGFDAAGNQSEYNQVWLQMLSGNDSTIVLTAIVPIMLHQKLVAEGMYLILIACKIFIQLYPYILPPFHAIPDKLNILWMNRKPSSTNLCRPLELEFTKETKDFIKLKAAEIQNAIKNLEVTVVKVGDKTINCSHKVLFTMMDGKVSSAITDTGAANCNICGAKPSEMNDLEKVLTRECKKDVIEMALPVLHLHIRFLEYFLNIAKRLFVAEQCYGKYSEAQKKGMQDRHRLICKRLQNEVGIKLDQPTSKGGNTNTGNNARRFFDHAVKVKY